MDSYIAQQIVLWMLIAVFLGFAIGWIARGRKAPKQSRSPMRRLR